ncbi:voltage-gated potassium channel subunit beta-3 [Struthio camelus]|uniref:voltage-gated potassium channel subunit beta-3 n=1 Tax=Struthio camelus TaxID=8801 RepID=UPI0036041F1D
MKYRALGKCGLRVSCLGLGTGGTFGADVSEEAAGGLLSVAFEHGVNLFDTAGGCAPGRAEKVLGDALKSKGWRRSSYVVTTRVCWGGPAEAERGLSRKHVVEGLQGSLRRLQLDYVDVVFAGRPQGPAPMEELVRAMTDVINQGLALYWGTARWSAAEIMEAFAVARQCNLVAPVCQRAPLPARERPPALPRLHRQIGLGTVTWSPLAAGLDHDEPLPHGARHKGPSEAGCRQQAPELQPLAQRLGCSVPQLAIAWSLRAEGVSSVLLAATSPQQLLENLGALQVLPHLTPPVLQELEALLGPKKEPRA